MTSVLSPGETCWRKTRSDRVAFLVDNQAYFAAVAHGYPALGYRDYLTQMFGETCLASRDHAARISASP